jgi:hypothetical protein
LAAQATDVPAAFSQVTAMSPRRMVTSHEGDPATSFWTAQITAFGFEYDAQSAPVTAPGVTAACSAPAREALAIEIWA